MPLLRHSAPDALVKVEDYRLPATTEQEQRYEALYRVLYPRLIDYARRFARRADAEDAVHEAMAAIWSRWALIAPAIEGEATPYFFAAVRQQIGKMRRRKRRTERFLSSGKYDGVSEWSARVAKPAVELDRTELRKVLDATVAAMPERPRAAWMLVRENELTYEQAAHSLDIAPVSMKQLITRAQRLLREALVEAGYRLSTRILATRSRGSPKQLPMNVEGDAHE
jgi:RNA polymerase sigma factor (sigma-70 family)